MSEYYTLEYKNIDSKGREKNAKFVGVFLTLQQLDNAKKKLLENSINKISFQIYNHNNIFP